MFKLVQGVQLARRLLLSVILAIPMGLPAQSAQPDEKIIVSGASGQLGELTVKELLRRGVAAKNLILVSRTPEKLAEYAKLGAVVRFGDLTKPESLPGAYAGGTRMLLISISGGSNPRPPLHKAGFDAAVKAGVKHIVYTSFIGADTGTSGLAVDHRQSEEALKASGAKWTMLRNGLYADRVVQQAVEMVKAGRVTVTPNEAKSAPVTREDCAAVAAGALLNAKFENTAFDITGPALFDRRDIAAAASAITGKRIEVVEQAAATAPAAPSPMPAGAPPQGALPQGAPAAGMGGGGMMTPAIATNAVAELSGRPATGLRAILEANKEQLLAAAK